MPAMHDEVLEIMTTKLMTFRDRMVRLIPFQMTHQDCLDLIAPSNIHTILREAAQVAEDVSAYENWISLSVPGEIDGEKDVGCQLMMRTHGDVEPPLRPRFPRWQTGAKSGIMVREWLTKRLELGRKFGLACRMLTALNSDCDNGHQLRYMLPAVMHLVQGSSNERVVKWAQKHAAYKPCKHVPHLDLIDRRAVQDVGALITSCVLIGEDIEATLTPDAGVTIDCWALSTFMHNGHFVPRK